MGEGILFSFFLIFTGAAVLATAALYSRQPLLMAYIVLGAFIGPYGAGLVTDVELLSQVASIGIMFLLFLLGLDMQPAALLHVLRPASVVTVISGLLFFGAGYGVSELFGFASVESVIIGLAMVNSSTIIGIKLLPTTVLHHRHMGELMVGLLLVQDLVALLMLVAIAGMQSGKMFDLLAFGRIVVALPVLVGVALGLVRYALVPLFQRFDRFHEYLFLVAIGWCLGMAELSHAIGLSGEAGAFVAGVALASSPVAQFIALSLRPLRDFFLILFFFALGARFDLGLLPDIIWPVLVMAALMVSVKPMVFRLLLGRFSERSELAWDVGFRLGQISEFSLLMAYVAVASGVIGERASLLIQATAIVTFVVSSYIVVFNYPTPIAVNEKLRRD